MLNVGVGNVKFWFFGVLLCGVYPYTARVEAQIRLPRGSGCIGSVSNLYGICLFYTWVLGRVAQANEGRV